jgi:hypothetical protein
LAGRRLVPLRAVHRHRSGEAGCVCTARAFSNRPGCCRPDSCRAAGPRWPGGYCHSLRRAGRGLLVIVLVQLVVGVRPARARPRARLLRSSSASASSTVVAVPACATCVLKVAQSAPNGYAGGVTVTIRFTYTSAAKCRTTARQVHPAFCIQPGSRLSSNPLQRDEYGQRHGIEGSRAVYVRRHHHLSDIDALLRLASPEVTIKNVVIADPVGTESHHADRQRGENGRTAPRHNTPPARGGSTSL